MSGQQSARSVFLGSVLLVFLSCLLVGGAWLARSSRAAAGPIQLVRLSIGEEGGTVRVELIADSSLADLAIEQEMRKGAMVVRIRGARSLLRPSYPIDAPLVRGVRTLSGARDGEPFVEIIIDTNKGATVAQRKNFNRLVIAIAADFAQLRRRRAPPAAAPAVEVADARRPAPTPLGAVKDKAPVKRERTVVPAPPPPSSSVSYAPLPERQFVNAAAPPAGAAPARPPAASDATIATVQNVFRGRTIWGDLVPTAPDYPVPLVTTGLLLNSWQSPNDPSGTAVAMPAGAIGVFSFAPMRLEAPGARLGAFVPGTSVPERDEIGGRILGPGLLRPLFSFGAEYDDNFFYRSGDERPLGIFTFGPRLEYEVPGQERAYRVAYEGRFRRLSNGEWASGQSVDFDGRRDLSPFVRLGFRNHLVRSALDPREYDPAGETYITGDTFTRNDAALRLEYASSERDHLGLEVGYDIVRWDEEKIAGTPLFINYGELLSSAFYERELAPETTAVLLLSVGNTVASAPLRPRFDGLNNRLRYAFEFGSRTRLSETSQLMFKVGYERSDFRRAPEANDFNGVIFDLSYRQDLSEQMNFEVAALRKTQISSFNLEGGNARLVSTGVAARLARRQAEALELALGLSYQRLGFPVALVADSTASGGIALGDFAGSTRDDDLYGFSFEAGYRWSDLLRSRFVYGFSRRASSLPVLTFNRHRLSLVFEFGRRQNTRGRPF